MVRAWTEAPAARPTFDTIVSTLEAMNKVGWCARYGNLIFVLTTPRTSS